MKIALPEMVVEGVQTTVPVHQMLMESRLFIRGEYHTQTLDNLLIDWQLPRLITPEEAAAVYVAVKDRVATPSSAVPSRMARQSGWRSSFQESSGLRPALYVEGA